MRIIVLTPYILTVVFCLCNQYAKAQNNQPSPGIKGAGSPKANPWSPVTPNPGQQKSPINPSQTSPGGATINRQLSGDIKDDLKSEDFRYQQAKYIRTTKLYQDVYTEFMAMDPDHFPISKAVYLTESAYDRQLPPYEVFEAEIKKWGTLVRQILKSEGLSEHNNIAVNYAIQKLYTQSNIYYDSITKRTVNIPPLSYDFNDFMGDKDWRKMFVSKLLNTGTGQCHSLPLLFLCIAEQFHARAWLSLSPNHSFIQYFDEKGRRYNFETTSGSLVTQSWLAYSTNVNATALKNKTWLDTLSARQIYAQCLGDLLTGYLIRAGQYDDLAGEINQKILSIDPVNMQGLIILLNHHAFRYRELEKAAHYPPEKDFPQYPELYKQYQLVKYYTQKIQQRGFQEMPEEAYQKWLKSLEFEKQRQQNRLEQERLKQEIERLKKIKVTIRNNPKR